MTTSEVDGRRVEVEKDSSDGGGVAATVAIGGNDGTGIAAEDFVSSMTFARRVGGKAFGDDGSSCGCGGCCDECGGPSAVPAEIRDAVREHLRKRKAEHPLYGNGGGRAVRVAQRRNLVKREGGFSIWKWTLPPHLPGGDPFVEHRNNHRVVYVDKLPRASAVLSVGKGIIGSSAEQNDRQRVDWEVGAAYFLPRKAGIACGWIHQRREDYGEGGGAAATSGDAVDGDEGDDVVIYVLKASPEAMTDAGGDGEKLSPWANLSYGLFRTCLAAAGRTPPNGEAAGEERASSGIFNKRGSVTSEEEDKSTATTANDEEDVVPMLRPEDRRAVRDILRIADPKNGDDF